MSTPFNDKNGPQPPLLLKAPLEIYSNLRQLQQSHDPLFISFPDRNQRYQSYLLEVSREHNLLALDELIPNEGERFLRAGEPFKIEGYHEGVRIAWRCEQQVSIDQLDGAPCYWAPIPEEITYHQRRNAFRAKLPLGEVIQAELRDPHLSKPLSARLIDISASGCKVRFTGDARNQLTPGEILEELSIKLPFGTLSTAIEIRHVEFSEKDEYTFAGLRFESPSGLQQRLIDRYVYQLQREARRNEG